MNVSIFNIQKCTLYTKIFKFLNFNTDLFSMQSFIAEDQDDLSHTVRQYSLSPINDEIYKLPLKQGLFVGLKQGRYLEAMFDKRRNNEGEI